MAATALKISCRALLLLEARAAAINAGGVPFGSMLPFWHEPSSDDAPQDAGKGVAAKNDTATDDAATGVSPVVVAKEIAPPAAGKPAARSVVQAHGESDAPPKAATLTDGKARLTASMPEASKPPTKSANAGSTDDAIAKLVKRTEALIRSSSIALENYASASADAHATVEEQRKATKFEERAEAAMENVLATLREEKMKRLEVTKQVMKSNPLEAPFHANEGNIAKIEGRIASAEGRVDLVNRKATSYENQVEDATSRLEQSRGAKAKYGTELKAALKQAEVLANLLKAAEERHELQMKTLEDHAKGLESEDAALVAAISDAKAASKGLTAHNATKAHEDSHSIKAVAGVAGTPHPVAAEPPKPLTASFAAIRPDS